MEMEEKKVVLEARNMKKIYNYQTPNEFEALHNINFKVYEGEFVSIMGPSGSGKSTFINNISTIDECTGGNVFINGKNVRAMTANEIGHFRYENLGFIFQDFNLLDTHTMYENIAMPLALAHVSKDRIEARVNELAKEMKIDMLLKKYPNECSGGQRQRASICRALVNHPRIIVADEPTGNLDSKNGKEVMDLLKELNAEGTTIVMVTHSQKDAAQAQRTIDLFDGQIVSDVKNEL